MHNLSVSLWDLRTIPLWSKWTKDLTLYCFNKIKEIMILLLQNSRKPVRQTILLIGIIWWVQFQSSNKVSNNIWIYVYIKKTWQNFNSNSNSNSWEFQLQFQLQLWKFQLQLQLQLRPISRISTPTPTPTPGVSTPTPTPTPASLLNINSNCNSGGFNSNSNSNSGVGVGVEPNSNSNSGVDPNPDSRSRWRPRPLTWPGPRPAKRAHHKHRIASSRSSRHIEFGAPFTRNNDATILCQLQDSHPWSGLRLKSSLCKSFGDRRVVDIKNNAWITVNNDFWVTSEAICQ